MDQKKLRLRLDERVGYRFAIISKRMNQSLSASYAKKFGISVNNWKILSAIGFFAPLSATELGARTSLDSDKVTRAVDTLVKCDYVVRLHDQQDRRKIVLSLSKEGKRVHDNIELVASQLEGELLSVLSANERKVLRAAVEKLELHSRKFVGKADKSFERRNMKPRATVPKRRSKTVRTSGKSDVTA